MNESGLAEELLRTSPTIAVVGYSPSPIRPSNTVSRYLRAQGYRIIPVNPQLGGALVDGEHSYDRVRDIPERVDLVDVFRRGTYLDEVVDDALAAGVKAIWFQIGLINVAAAERAERLGLRVVWDKCTSIEHRRLVRDGRAPSFTAPA